MTTSIRSNIKGINFLFIFYTSYYVHYIVIRLLMLSFLFYSIIDISKLWRVNMKFFYEGINKFMYKHPFIKSCVYFASKFCPWMVAIFYSLFLLKIVIESQTGFYLLFIKPFVVLLIYIYAFYIKKCYFSSATVRNQRNIVIVGGSNHEISLS
jgi:hypothetical protein